MSLKLSWKNTPKFAINKFAWQTVKNFPFVIRLNNWDARRVLGKEKKKVIYVEKNGTVWFVAVENVTDNGNLTMDYTIYRGPRSAKIIKGLIEEHAIINNIGVIIGYGSRNDDSLIKELGLTYTDYTVVNSSLKLSWNAQRFPFVIRFNNWDARRKLGKEHAEAIYVDKPTESRWKIDLVYLTSDGSILNKYNLNSGRLSINEVKELVTKYAAEKSIGVIIDGAIPDNLLFPFTDDRIVESSLKLSWQSFPLMIVNNNDTIKKKELGKQQAKYVTNEMNNVFVYTLDEDGASYGSPVPIKECSNEKEALEYAKNYAIEHNIWFMENTSFMDYWISKARNLIRNSSLKLSIVDMPAAEQDSAYDLTTNPAPEETEQYNVDYKKEENNPLQNRYEPQNEEKFFEKGLHQNIENSQTERPLMPYGSLKLSTEISDAQKDAGNYRKQHIQRDGLDISIENKKGSTRSGISSDGKKWSTVMKNPYGYIKGTVGRDKDHLDIFLSNDYKEGQPVFIVNQLKKGGSFDEHKCMIGFETKDAAEKAYLANYEKGWDQYKNIVEMPMTLFKTWMIDKKLTQEPVPEDLQFKKLKSSLGFTDTEPYDKSYATMEGEVEIPINDLSVVFKNSLAIFDDYDKFTLVKGVRPNVTNSMSTKYILYGVDSEGFSHKIKETYYGEKSELEYLYNKYATPELVAANLKIAYDELPSDPEDLLRQGKGGRPFVYDRNYKRLYTGNIRGTHPELIYDMAVSHTVPEFDENTFDLFIHDLGKFEHLTRFFVGRVSDNGDICAFWFPMENPNSNEFMDCIWELLSKGFITRDCKLKFANDPEYYSVSNKEKNSALLHAFNLPSNAEILQLYNKYAKGYDYTKEVFNLRDKLVPSLEALIENSTNYEQLYKTKIYDNAKQLKEDFLNSGGIEDYVSLGMNVGNVQKAISMLSSATDDKQCMVAVDYALSIMHDAGPLILTTLISDMPDYERLEQMLELLSQLRYQGELRESTSAKTSARATDRIFVCLWLPKEVEERFDHIRGLEDELHMTVAYAATSKLSEDNKQEVLNSLSKVAKDYSKIKCKFTGIAAFKSPEKPIVALINVQDGAEFHLDIINAIKKVIGEWDKKYDFIPHVTLQTGTNGRSKLKDLKRFSWTAHTIGVAFNDSEKYLIDLDTGRIRKSLAKQAWNTVDDPRSYIGWLVRNTYWLDHRKTYEYGVILNGGNSVTNADDKFFEAVWENTPNKALYKYRNYKKLPYPYSTITTSTVAFRPQLVEKIEYIGLDNTTSLLLNCTEVNYDTDKKLAGTIAYNQGSKKYSAGKDNPQEPGAYQETGAIPDAGTPQGNAETSIVDITAEDIIILHDEAVSKYGGAAGSKPDTEGKIEAAIGRMSSGFGAMEFYPTLFEKAAVLAHSIITTHPFTDGNKRTAFLAAVTFLHNNNITVEESDQLADIIIRVASNDVGYEHLLQWIQQNAHELEKKHEKALRLLSSNTVQDMREGKGLPFMYDYNSNYLWVGSSNNPHANAMNVDNWVGDELVGRIGSGGSTIAFWNPADLPQDTSKVLYCLMLLQQKGVLAGNAVIYFVDDATAYTKQQLQGVTAMLKLADPLTYTDASDVDQSSFNNSIDQFHQEDHRDINNGRDWMWGETDYRTGFPDPSNENVVQKLDQDYPEALLADSALKLNSSDQDWNIGFPVLDNPFIEGVPDQDKVKAMHEWLRNNADKYENKHVKFYHGTDPSLPILDEGLKPTSMNRRRSYQSEPGYVYLANTPERAKSFGDIGTGTNSKVYEVVVPVRKLKADKDQLSNLRSVGQNIGNSVAESMIYGGGVRVKGKIEPWQIKEYKFPEKESSLKLSWHTPIIGMKVKSKRDIYSKGHKIPKGEIAEIIRLTPMILLSFSGFKVVITNNSFYDDFEEVYTKSSFKLASDDAAFDDYSTDRGLKLMYYDSDVPTGDQATDMHQSYDTDLRLPDNQKTEKEFDTTNWVGRENMVPSFGV